MFFFLQRADWNLAAATVAPPQACRSPPSANDEVTSVCLCFYRTPSVCAHHVTCYDCFLSLYFSRSHVYSPSLLRPVAALSPGTRRCRHIAHVVRMAALWYNLPNYLSPYIIPFSAAAGEEIGFMHVDRQQLHPLKQTTTSAHLPGPPFFFFCLPPSPFVSPSLSGGQVTLNYSSV